MNLTDRQRKNLENEVITLNQLIEDSKGKDKRGYKEAKERVLARLNGEKKTTIPTSTTSTTSTTSKKKQTIKKEAVTMKTKGNGKTNGKSTIKSLVLHIFATKDEISAENVVTEVKKNFPDSKFNATHYYWYTKQIRSGAMTPVA